MLLTPNEAIKKIQEWYKTDMEQPIMLLVDDVDNLFSILDNDSRFKGLYKSEQDIPKEIIQKCFDGITNDDRVWDSIKESYAFDIDQHIDKEMETQKDIETDEPLWNN